MPESSHPPAARGPFKEVVDNVIRPRGKVFFGWWVVLASAGIQLIGGLFFAHSFSLYVVELKSEFGWSNFKLSLAFALTRNAAVWWRTNVI